MAPTPTELQERRHRLGYKHNPLPWEGRLPYSRTPCVRERSALALCEAVPLPTRYSSTCQCESTPWRSHTHTPPRCESLPVASCTVVIEDFQQCQKRFDCCCFHCKVSPHMLQASFLPISFKADSFISKISS